MKNRSGTLRKLDALWRHPATPPNEAALAASKARVLRESVKAFDAGKRQAWLDHREAIRLLRTLGKETYIVSGPPYRRNGREWTIIKEALLAVRDRTKGDALEYEREGGHRAAR